LYESIRGNGHRYQHEEQIRLAEAVVRLSAPTLKRVITATMFSTVDAAANQGDPDGTDCRRLVLRCAGPRNVHGRKEWEDLDSSERPQGTA
jgi:hypothetical protein